MILDFVGDWLGFEILPVKDILLLTSYVRFICSFFNLSMGWIGEIFWAKDLTPSFNVSLMVEMISVFFWNEMNNQLARILFLQPEHRRIYKLPASSIPFFLNLPTKT